MLDVAIFVLVIDLQQSREDLLRIAACGHGDVLGECLRECDGRGKVVGPNPYYGCPGWIVGVAP
jgi:hypothetical protein